MPETTQFSGMQEKGNNANDGALQQGSILIARYRIEGQLGGGGQGAVYQARDMNFPEARRLVAVKEMHVNTKDDNLKKEALKTFKREANILATLAHPAIPKIYDFFEQNGRAYVVMEYINGRDLEALLVKTKSLPMDKIIEWGIDLCDVLHYLHEHKPEPIIFRDMKPANVMIDSLGKVRLIDFGIAKIFVRDLPQTMIGTEGYSAPEQYKGNANPSSDIFSLGATLHHVITRKDPRLELPFSFDDRPLRDFDPKAPSGLQAILDKALAYEPEKRYETCAQMKEDLEALKYQAAGVKVITAGSKEAAQASDNGTGVAVEEGTDFFDAEGEDGTGGIQPIWKFKTEDEIRSNPVVHQNIVFVGSYDTNLWALNIETGEMMWRHATEGGIASSPVIDEEYGQVLFGSEDHSYMALDIKNGKVNWTHYTDDKVRGGGSVAHGHVFFGSDDYKIYALIAGNGRFMWDYEVDSPIRGTPCVTADRVIFGTENGEIVALELSGEKKWSYRTRRGVLSTPVVDDDNICYVGSFDGYVYALDANNGYSQWRFRTLGPVASSPALVDEMLFVGSADGKVYCINVLTGKEIWKQDLGAPIVSSPRVHQGVVYIGGTDNKLYALDTKKGKELWQFEAGGQITSTPYIANNLIIFGSLDRTLYALPIVSV